MARKPANRIDLATLQDALEVANDDVREAVAQKEAADALYEAALSSRGDARTALRQATIELTNQ